MSRYYNSKIILVDIDGVILNWVSPFCEFMYDKGYKNLDKSHYAIEKMFSIPKEEAKKLIREFNESERIRNLPPHEDAVKYVKKIHEQYGYVFHCITSLSKDPKAYEMRVENIKSLFGDTAFERFIVLDTGEDKTEALKEYKDTGIIWVEDKIENAVIGMEMGLDAYIMHHGHNRHSPVVNSPNRMVTWKSLWLSRFNDFNY